MFKFTKLLVLLFLSLFLIACDGDIDITDIITEDTTNTSRSNTTTLTTNDNSETEDTTILTNTEETTTIETTVPETTTTEDTITTQITTTTEDIITTQITTTTETTTTEATTTTQTLVTISFISNGGTQVSSVEALPGTFISSPVDPVKAGYEFIGWYNDETLTNLYVFSEMPDENIVLYAGWEEIISSTDILTTTLIDYGFICTVNECSLEISTGYTYIYDKVNKLFIYEKITSDETGGYRYLTNTITIDTNWDVDFSYDLEENYGIEIQTKIELSGNALSGNYSVDYFYSTNRIESEVKEDAIEDIGYFVPFINSVLSDSELTMNDLK